MDRLHYDETGAPRVYAELITERLMWYGYRRDMSAGGTDEETWVMGRRKLTIHLRFHTRDEANAIMKLAGIRRRF